MGFWEWVTVALVAYVAVDAIGAGVWLWWRWPHGDD